MKRVALPSCKKSAVKVTVRPGDIIFGDGVEKSEVDIFSWVRRGDTISEIIGIKRAYYAVQNCVNVFDSRVKRVSDTQFENKDTTIFWREYAKDGAPLLAFWQYAEVQGDFKKTKEAPGFNLADGRTRYPRASDRCDTFPTVFRTKAPPMKKPVWVDLLTGRVYEIPAENVLASASGTVYVDVPCYDSPVVLTERAAVDLVR